MHPETYFPIKLAIALPPTSRVEARLRGRISTLRNPTMIDTIMGVFELLLRFIFCAERTRSGSSHI